MVNTSILNLEIKFFFIDFIWKIEKFKYYSISVVQGPAPSRQALAAEAWKPEPSWAMLKAL